MRKLIGLVLVIMLTTLANSQTEISVEAYSKELRFEKDVVKLVAIKTITYKAIVPKSDSGWVKESVNGQKWQDTFVIGQQTFSKTEAIYPIKNLNNKEFVKANCSLGSFDYDKAYKSPGKKVFYWYGGDKESTTYSNYFLKKTITHTNFWVMYHANIKNPYFEVGVSDKSESSVPWFRLLLLLMAISYMAEQFAKFSVLHGFFDDRTNSMDIFKYKIEYRYIYMILSVISIILINIVIIGIWFGILFTTNNSNWDLSNGERVIAWFVRLFLLCILTFSAYKQLKAKQKKDNKIVSNDGESLIDTTAGSE